MAKVWDDIMKRLFASSPQQFLNWLLPGAIPLGELSLALKTRTIEADVLYTIQWYGEKTSENGSSGGSRCTRKR